MTQRKSEDAPPTDAVVPAEAVIGKTPDGMVRLSYRVDAALKARFDGLAAFVGETPDARVARLMRADIEASSPGKVVTG